MIAFTVIVGDEFGHRPAEMAFTERDHLAQAFLLDRADKPLRIGIAVRRTKWCLHDSDTRSREEVSNGGTPFPIPSQIRIEGARSPPSTGQSAGASFG